MAAPIPESSNIIYHVTTATGIAILMTFYFFGVWSRSYIFPTENRVSIGRQLIAAIPVSLVTMALYAKSTFPTLTLASENFVYDCLVMLGYAILFGMLSRETLEHMMKGAAASQPGAAPR